MKIAFSLTGILFTSLRLLVYCFGLYYLTVAVGVYSTTIISSYCSEANPSSYCIQYKVSMN